MIISNNDTALTATGTVGLWCGQAQVAGDDCLATNQKYDNLVIIDQPRRIISWDWIDRIISSALAWNKPKGNWYMFPVIHERGVRHALATMLDKSGRFSNVIGYQDKPDEQALSFIRCPNDDYSKIEINYKVTNLIKRQEIEALGKSINPKFEIEGTYAE